MAAWGSQGTRESKTQGSAEEEEVEEEEDHRLIQQRSKQVHACNRSVTRQLHWQVQTQDARGACKALDGARQACRSSAHMIPPHRVEADEAEEDDGGAREGAADAKGQEGRVVLGLGKREA